MNIEVYQFMLDFIDVMAERGALRGKELYEVGLYRNRILHELEEAKNDMKEESEMNVE